MRSQNIIILILALAIVVIGAAALLNERDEGVLEETAEEIDDAAEELDDELDNPPNGASGSQDARG